MSAREPIMEVLDEPSVVRHRITVDDYYRMAEIGVLAPGAHIELIDGEVIDMAPMGTRHHSAVMRLNRLLDRAVGDAAHISVQLPVRLDKRNEPEPDLAVLKPRDDFYASALPTGKDCLLVIEVSDTTLAYDVRIKAPLYAKHGVTEYWVVDLAAGALRVYRLPKGNGWADVSMFKQPGRMALPGLVDSFIDLTGVL